MKEKMRVLIVDDSLIIRKAIHQHLSDNYNVEVVGMAENGIVALEMFDKTKPEYVTLDINMPELDGLSVLEQMLQRDPTVNVIIVTALSDKDTALQAIEMGAKGYVIKPLTFEKLQAAVNQLTAQEQN
jgi:two-component system chemotaxis response regulator CheY